MTTETIEFKAELKELLHLIVHSLYSQREIFLRELISNACDAIDKLRFEGLTKPALLEGGESWKIELAVDTQAKTLEIRDNGIGMTRAAIAEHLGVIAHSGTRKFLEALKGADGPARPELIGQFGVGFYSAFMVADTVEVTSRAAGGTTAVVWSSDGQGTFSLAEGTRDERGTTVRLHLKEEALEYLEEDRLTEIVKRYSDFVEHPIVLDGDTINSRQAIWRRNKADVPTADYTQFYRQVSRDRGDPARTIHYRAEGTLEFSALLFIPAKRPHDLMYGEPKSGLELYVNRVLITNESEKLLPPWLRFVKGVVESADLPLNVSREMIQEDKILGKIQQNLVRKVLEDLAAFKTEAYTEYLAFIENFGPLLKEGLAGDTAHRDALAELLLFPTMRSAVGERVSLAQYVEKMVPEQTAIYYLAGEDRARLDSSPHLEAFRSKGWDVLYFTDPIDEWVPMALPRYKDKPLEAADKGVLDVGPAPAEAEQKTYASLLEALGDKLEGIKAVRLSRRLVDSAACLVADEGSMGAHMERLLERMGQDAPKAHAKRTLELNASHPVVKSLLGLYEKDRGDARIELIGRVLHDQALIAEGSSIVDPAAFAKRLNALAERALEGAAGS